MSFVETTNSKVSSQEAETTRHPLFISHASPEEKDAVTARRQKALFALTDEAGFLKTLSGLASGSFAWVVSEPDKIVTLRDGASSPARLADLMTR